MLENSFLNPVSGALNAATPLTVSGDWNGIRLRAFGKGR